MKFRPFDIEKAAQAAAAIIRQQPDKRIGRLRLMKLLYIAHRRMLRRHGMPLFQARAVAMKHGPLHSEVLSVVNADGSDEPAWSSFFANEGTQIVRLMADPGASRLSDAEIQAINDTAEELAGYNDWEVVNLTHGFKEWIKNYPDHTADTSSPISLEDILAAIGRENDIDEIQSDLDEAAEFKRLMAS